MTGCKQHFTCSRQLELLSEVGVRATMHVTLQSQLVSKTASPAVTSLVTLQPSLMLGALAYAKLVQPAEGAGYILPPHINKREK